MTYDLHDASVRQQLTCARDIDRDNHPSLFDSFPTDKDHDHPFVIPADILDAELRLDADTEEAGTMAPRSVGSISRTRLDDDTYGMLVQCFDPFAAQSRLEGSNGFGGDSDRTTQMLTAMVEDAFSGLRPLTIATDATVAALNLIADEMPNCAPGLEVIRRAAIASARAQVPLAFEPLILLGPPGGGKTRFCRKVATALGAPFERISMVTSSGAMPLSGTDATWKASKPGAVAKILVEGGRADPLILVDEIDKPASLPHEQPLDVLHALWEPENARAFRDDSLQITMDVSHVRWIASANDVHSLRSSILDRAQVIEIAVPDGDQMRVVCQTIYREQAAGWYGFFAPDLSPLVLDRLVSLHPRAASKIVRRALVIAASEGRPELAPHDIDAAHGADSKRAVRRYGFV